MALEGARDSCRSEVIGPERVMAGEGAVRWRKARLPGETRRVAESFSRAKKERGCKRKEDFRLRMPSDVLSVELPG